MGEPTPPTGEPVKLAVAIKGGGSIAVATSELPDNVYAAALAIGMKDLLNRGMTKIKVRENGKALSGDQAEAAKAAALEIANKNYANLKQGKLPRMVGASKGDDKLPGVVKTEAMRLARNLIKDEIKAAGGKISHYEAKDITAAAAAFLETEEGKGMIVTAQANVAARAEAKAAIPPVATLADLQSKLGINVSAKKVEQAEKKKEKEMVAGNAVLSAAKAGNVKTRTASPAKGKQGQPTANLS